MAAPTTPDTPSAAVIGAGGVFLPAQVCEPIWRVLRAELARHTRDGGRVRPEVAQAVETLRAAAFNHVSTRGQDPRTYADMGASSEPRPLLSTADLASRLGVSERHARRIAHEEGIAPAARNAWHRADVAALAARRGA